MESQQTEKLIKEMLGFLDSTSEEDDDDTGEEHPKYSEEMEDTLNEEGGHPGTIVPHVAAKQDNYIATELKKIKSQFPIWKTKEIVTPAKKLNDPIWRQTLAPDTQWNSKLESTCRSNRNSFVQEVNRAIYGDSSGHPANGSPEYYRAAQNYAVYGKDFKDFPDNLTPLLSDNSNASTPTDVNNSGYGNGLYPTPMAPIATSSGMGFSNFGKQSGSSTAYYQMCNGGLQQPSVRPATVSTAYGMFLGNKVTYVAAAPTAQPMVYNQHSTTTTNFISNSLANAVLGSSPAIVYSNPMLTTTTQQYLNTFLKETQFLSGSSQGGATTGIYERLVYAQMLQQQIYHQNQQQAAAVAAMFKQQQQRAAVPRASNVSLSNSGQATPGLGLCGRQATNSEIPNSSDDTTVSNPLNN